MSARRVLLTPPDRRRRWSVGTSLRSAGCNPVVASGDRVVLRSTNTGTYSGALGTPELAGRGFEVADFMLVRMEDGLIAEQWGLFDLYSMFIQLGVMEPPRLGG